MERNYKKHLLITLGLILACAVAVDVLSPYQMHATKGKALMIHTVTIDAPAPMVYTYLGNSDHARDWSVYVDHISPIPTGVEDGKVGSKRRCFTQADEKGITWDEEILKVIPSAYRLLSVYNSQNFISSIDTPIRTEQIYKPLGDGKSTLSFTVYFDGEPSIRENILMHCIAFYVNHIFDKNLANIKSEVENLHHA